MVKTRDGSSHSKNLRKYRRARGERKFDFRENGDDPRDWKSSRFRQYDRKKKKNGTATFFWTSQADSKDTMYRDRHASSTPWVPPPTAVPGSHRMVQVP
jgi:hypothetical protein